MDDGKLETWAVLELMGHRRLGGYLREVTVAGAPFLRIDIPGAKPGEVYATQFYSAGAVYAFTPTTEETARALARVARPEPVHRWELPAPPSRAHEGDDVEPPV